MGGRVLHGLLPESSRKECHVRCFVFLVESHGFFKEREDSFPILALEKKPHQQPVPIPCEYEEFVSNYIHVIHHMIYGGTA